MIYFGQVLEITNRETYYKLVAGVQIGYGVINFILRVPEDNLPDGLKVCDKILFTGRTKSKDGIEQFHTESIFKRTYPTCDECGLPLTSEKCFLKHDVEAQKLTGEWRVVHKIESKGNIKMFFEKGHFVFAAVATPNQWMLSTFKDLALDDIVKIEGWRYRQSTSLMFVRKISLCSMLSI